MPGWGYSKKKIGKYVLLRFSNVGSLVLIFFLAWNWGLGKKFLLKLVSHELKFCQNQWKLGLKMHFFLFFQKMEVGSFELEKGLKWWVSGVKKWSEKEGQYILVLSSNVSAPRVHASTFSCFMIPFCSCLYCAIFWLAFRYTTSEPWWINMLQ